MANVRCNCADTFHQVPADWEALGHLPRDQVRSAFWSPWKGVKWRSCIRAPVVRAISESAWRRSNRSLLPPPVRSGRRILSHALNICPVLTLLSPLRRQLRLWLSSSGALLIVSSPAIDTHILQRGQGEVPRALRVLRRDAPARARSAPHLRTASRVFTLHARHRGREDRAAQGRTRARDYHHRVQSPRARAPHWQIRMLSFPHPQNQTLTMARCAEWARGL